MLSSVLSAICGLDSSTNDPCDIVRSSAGSTPCDDEEFEDELDGGPLEGDELLPDGALDEPDVDELL